MLHIFVCRCMKNATLQQHNLSSWRHRWKDLPRYLNDGAYANMLRLSVIIVVCDVVYCGYTCVLDQKLLLRAYRKSYMRNWLVPKWMILTFLQRSFKVLSTIASHLPYRAFAGPWKSWNNLSRFQGLESRWKQTWCLKVLESVSKGSWKCLNLIF